MLPQLVEHGIVRRRAAHDGVAELGRAGRRGARRGQLGVVPDAALAQVQHDGVGALGGVAVGEAPPDLAPAGVLEAENLLALGVVEFVEEPVEVEVVRNLAHDTVVGEEPVGPDPVVDAVVLDHGLARQDRRAVGDRVELEDRGAADIGGAHEGVDRPEQARHGAVAAARQHALHDLLVGDVGVARACPDPVVRIVLRRPRHVAVVAVDEHVGVDDQNPARGLGRGGGGQGRVGGQVAVVERHIGRRGHRREVRRPVRQNGRVEPGDRVEEKVERPQVVVGRGEPGGRPVKRRRGIAVGVEGHLLQVIVAADVQVVRGAARVQPHASRDAEDAGRHRAEAAHLAGQATLETAPQHVVVVVRVEPRSVPAHARLGAQDQRRCGH